MNRNRFKDALWFDKPNPIILGGAGGISSWAALLLCRSNRHNIYMYDFDLIEDHNLAGQFFKEKQIGETKTLATANNVREFCPDSSISLEGIYDKDSMACPIMIAGFDNMLARRLMYDNWKKQEDRELFIDPRLAAENYQVYYVQKGQEERYEKTLFTDDEVEADTCTLKATSHFAVMVAGKIVQGLNAYLANKEAKEEVYVLPFFVHEVGQVFNLEVEV